MRCQEDPHLGFFFETVLLEKSHPTREWERISGIPSRRTTFRSVAGRRALSLPLRNPTMGFYPRYTLVDVDASPPVRGMLNSGLSHHTYTWSIPRRHSSCVLNLNTSNRCGPCLAVLELCTAAMSPSAILRTGFLAMMSSRCRYGSDFGV
jgi:hypothetical protein